MIERKISKYAILIQKVYKNFDVFYVMFYTQDVRTGNQLKILNNPHYLYKHNENNEFILLPFLESRMPKIIS